jgi:hypothetical protein
VIIWEAGSPWKRSELECARRGVQGRDEGRETSTGTGIQMTVAEERR